MILIVLYYIVPKGARQGVAGPSHPVQPTELAIEHRLQTLGGEVRAEQLLNHRVWDGSGQRGRHPRSDARRTPRGAAGPDAALDFQGVGAAYGSSVKMGVI